MVEGIENMGVNLLFMFSSGKSKSPEGFDFVNNG